MCITVFKKVIKITGRLAILSGGSAVVVPDGIGEVKKGDYLEVYGGLALSKRPVFRVRRVSGASKGGNL